MRNNPHLLEIAILNSLTFMKVLPIIQIISVTIALIISYRNIVIGIKTEGSFKKYLKSFFW